MFCHFCKKRETTFVTFCLLSCTPSPFWKGCNLNRKNLLPVFFFMFDFLCTKSLLTRRIKFFPFRLDPFSEERQNSIDRVASLERVSIFLNILFWQFLLFEFEKKTFTSTASTIFSRPTNGPVVDLSPLSIKLFNFPSWYMPTCFMI